MYEYPKWIVLQLLTKCNLRCKMCYEWGEEGTYLTQKSSEILDIELVKSILQESVPYNSYFELFGGEPLLYPDLEDLLETFHHLDLSYDFPTNGTLLEEKADLLTSYEAKRIWVSIDGPQAINDFQRGKHTYEKALRGIEKISFLKQKKAKKYPQLGCTMVVTADNYNRIEELFTKDLDPALFNWFSIELQLYITPKRYKAYQQVLTKMYGMPIESGARGLIRETSSFDRIDIEKVIQQINNVHSYCQEHDISLIGYPKIKTYNNLKQFYTGHWDDMEEKKKHCSLPWIYAEIGANGQVTPCHTFYDFSMGNVNEQKLKEIWNQKQAKQLRKELRENLMPICIACSRYYSEN